ncbi:large conductance mechanosensitive channel protein MscL [Pseudoclavibacter chungangensis]|uniref:Large-conductance mechanosensitive channel n=1 Tax=Pseudoclavibacter chungangensis TaxID=587635 RepID=A0A7J5C2X2_9MICO|nr:large conductance mechanosensitive channel protein MscL [Pseudoclavibacter chungangensis]KAB1660403.1 large conductance mechanosensitive channel protein MscL [Pseudoclavibacter chungangensis]NYJ65769.1 large conductance mechanosensitive channel [Pseudoclavibacter chungangensis]
MKGFKDFILRGNVIDLAVAVVIGAAFTAIVNGLVDGIFNPVISAIFNADEISKATIQIGSVNLGVGLVIAAVIQFLLIAAVVYFALILPMNKFKEAAYVRKHGHPEPEAAAEVTDVELLTQIRDLLKAQQSR